MRDNSILVSLALLHGIYQTIIQYSKSPKEIIVILVSSPDSRGFGAGYKTIVISHRSIKLKIINA